MNSKREFGGGDVVDAKIPKKMDPAEEEYKVKQRSNVIAWLSIIGQSIILFHILISIELIFDL